MVQANPISPGALAADYGADTDQFEERRLLEDYERGRLTLPDWNGATWPPCAIHRDWWIAVGGYSEGLSPGFYSDVDFSMKLWHLGCRQFHGLGSSIAYHFGESTTSRVRGPNGRNVKKARIQFLSRWGILPSTFRKYYLNVDKPPMSVLPPASLDGSHWEKARLTVLGLLNSVGNRRAAA
jgi:hypothetical protein